MKLEKDTTIYGKLSAVIGAIGMITWLIPLLGVVVSSGAVVSSAKAIGNEEDGWPIAGMTLGIVALILAVMRSGLVYIYG